MSSRHLLTLGLVLLLAACTSLGPSSRRAGVDEDLARQILVTTRQSTSVALGLVGDPSTVYVRRPGYGPAADVNRLLDQIAREHALDRVDGWLISSLGVYCEVYALGPGQDREEMLARLRSDPRIESAQAMYVFETEAVRYDDPYAAMQPALTSLSINLVHELATGRGVTVAVIDSMVDDSHPEMRGRVPVRRDLVRGRKARGHAEVHGTAVAGVIASMANNAQGIVGVAPDAEIESLRACWTVDEASGRAECSSFSLAQALEVALRSRVDVVNMSLSGPRDPLVERLIGAALEDEVVVVAALPDGELESVGFPASQPGVIAVGSPGHYASTAVNVLKAPGSEIISTAPGAGYAFFSGNSMSSAFVAGVAALLRERRPGMSGEQVYRVLADTSMDDTINACRAFDRLNGTGECQDLVSDGQNHDHPD